MQALLQAMGFKVSFQAVKKKINKEKEKKQHSLQLESSPPIPSISCSFPSLPSLTLGVLEIVPPQRTDLVLATHIPHREADVLVLHRLHVEAFSKEKG